VAVAQAFLPALRRANGRIINIGGGAGRMTLPVFGALSSSKAALDSLSSALRMELRHQSVCVEPGGLDTAFFRNAEAASAGQLRRVEQPLARAYAAAIDAARKALAATKPTPVDTVARTILRALRARSPAPRYVVGRDARVGLFLLPRLPTWLADAMTMSMVGLQADLFSAPSAPGLPAGRDLSP
jgi:NAD(P)-dependent dehydrogenase (short-subunit alcohol dehydrogenase family)